MRRLALLVALPLVACSNAEPEPEPEHVVGLDVELIAELDYPIDATPSADGRDIYVVTRSQVVLLRDGEVIPMMLGLDFGSAVVSDAAGLYVADRGAGAVFSFDPEGNATLVPGSDELDPLALHLGAASLHVAGVQNGEFIVVELPREGGTPTLVASGFPGSIGGVTVTGEGTIYVTGEADALGESGAVFEIVEGQPVELASGFTLGDPAGLALTPDDAALMVSALSETGTSEVVIVSRSDGSISLFDEVIQENTASGGLHRAADDPSVYAWADASEGLGGVYRVKF